MRTELKPIQNIVQEKNVRPYKSKAQKNRKKIIAVIAAVIVLLGIGAYYLILPGEKIYTLKDYEVHSVTRQDLVKTTQASGEVIFPVQINVLSPEQGYSYALYVNDGDTVRKEQILARLDVPDLEDELDDLSADLETAKRDLLKTNTQYRFSKSKLEREIKAMEGDIAEMEDEISTLKELVAINASRQSELDDAEDELEELMENKEESEISLEEDRELEEIDTRIRTAEISQLETSIARLHERIAACSITSPMGGEIIDMESSLGVPGSYISANMQLFTIADPDSAEVELDVLEDYAPELKTGQEISLTVGGKNLMGNISSVGRVAEISSDGLGASIKVRVKPRIENTTLLLGSSATGVLELGKIEGALLLPRGPYLTTGSQKYVYRVDGNRASRVVAAFGNIEGNVVEILSGVKEGDVIITSGYQNFIEYDTVRLVKGE